MSNELIINVHNNEVTIALVEDKQLVELHKEKSDVQFCVGDIYLGRVKKIMPGLNAAFVDVGSDKDAFLHYLDIGPQFLTLQKYVKLALQKKGKTLAMQRNKNDKDIDKSGKIADVLTSGQLILVQVVKEPISTKGPRLSAEISLAGRNMVVMPFYDRVSVSQKIESDDERSRLKTLIHSIKPKNYGVIVRTVAESKKVAVFDAELRALVKKWETAIESLRGADKPRLVVGELSRVSSILRDYLNVSFSNIHVDNDAAYEEIKEYITSIAPEKEKIVRLYQGHLPIFEYFNIEKQIKILFGKTVSVKSGAYLIIEHTEALHVIDVNSGNRSKSAKDQESNALEVNMLAVQEIARQLRLRDMGGIVVVDFIDMHDNDHRQQVYDKMKEMMEQQKAKHNILPLSKFGLMQITRQRVRPDMSIDTNEKCPTCRGEGKIQSTIYIETEIETAVKTMVEQEKLRFVKIRVHPYIASYLKYGFPSIRLKWMMKYGCLIRIIHSLSHNLLDYKFIYSEKLEYQE
jgi:ribonuclease G